MLMKKISLLLLLMMAFTVSVVGQALPKPLNPSVQEWLDDAYYDEDSCTYSTSAMIHLNYGTDIMGNPVADDYTIDKFFNGEPYTILEESKVSYSIYTDNDKPFVFTPSMYPRLFNDVYPGLQEATMIPYRYVGGDIEFWGPHFPGLTNEVEYLAQYGVVIEPFFTWRIGVQMNYTEDGQTSSSDIVYMEVFPQLKPATVVTPTTFLADWSCDDENTFILNNFEAYDLYVINVATGDTIVINDITPTNESEDEWGNSFYLPGATYTVEGLTPGATYRYYVAVRDNIGNVYKSVVQEVTLPMSLVMLPADENYINKTSFRADWTNAADPSTVQDYTLYVTPQGAQSILTENFSGVTVEEDDNANIANYLNQYCDNQGWDGSYLYQAAGGGLKAGNSSNGGVLISPALDLSNSGGVITVKFNGKYYNTDNTTVTVSCGDASQTVELTADPTDYTVVLSGVPAAAGQKVTISSSGSRKRWYIYNVEVLTGNADAVAEPMVFTGITDTNYTVQNLTPGTTYDYYVVANYVDGTTETSNTESVTLPMPSAPALIVDPETLSISASYGETVTATFQVLGSDLTGDVTIALDDETDMFSVTPATISIADSA